MISVYYGDTHYNELYTGETGFRCTDMFYVPILANTKIEFTFNDDRLIDFTNIVMVDTTNNKILVCKLDDEGGECYIHNEYNYKVELFVYGMTNNELLDVDLSGYVTTSEYNALKDQLVDLTSKYTLLQDQVNELISNG